MKKKELLQKSSTVAAVVLAAALMDPGAVQASAQDTGVAAAQVQEQSAETKTAEENEAAQDDEETEESAQEAETEPEEQALENDSKETADTEKDEQAAPAESTAQEQNASDSGQTVQETENTDTAEFASKAGWITDEYGETKYRKEDGTFACGEILKIDGKLYYFYDNGALSKGGVFTIEDPESGDYDYYESDENGELLVNQWNAYESWYYGEDGKAVKDQIRYIDGSYYAFSEYANKLTNGKYYVHVKQGDRDEVQVIAREDGELYANEWTELWGDRYYCGENGVVYQGFQTVDGKQYFFDESEGVLYENTTITTTNGNCYIVGENGEAVQAKNNAWTKWEGYYYYVRNNAFLQNTVAKIGNALYGFDYQGRMYDDERFQIDKYDEDGNCTESKEYCAKPGGALYAGEWRTTEYGGRFYYQTDGTLCRDQVYTIDGKQYYFDETGWMVSDQGVSWNGKVYLADGDGILTELKNNSWNEIDGEYYYVKDGSLLTNCVEKIGKYYYGFEWNGAMYRDTLFYIWNDDEETGGQYCAKANGQLRTGWYEDGDTRYYFGSDGKGYEGIQTVDGEQYYFEDGSVVYGAGVEINGKLYVIDYNGVLHDAKNNAWTKVDGEYYYVKDGKFLKECVAKIGNAFYGFDGRGVLFVEQDFSIWDDEEGREFSYRAGKDGALYIGKWYDDGAEKYYYGADGKGYEGIQTVDGKQYYFRYGKMYTSGAFTSNGKSYLCREDGSLLEMKNNTWTLYNGNYYYVKDQEVLRDCVEKIGGSYYGFDTDGEMYDHTFFDINLEDEDGYHWRRHFAKEGGALYQNCWVKNGIWWYYVGEKGAAYTGIQKISGKQYYFDENGRLSTNALQTIDGQVYDSDSNGVLTKVNGNNTWKRLHGNWYYIKDQKLLSDGVYRIGNTYYGFRYDGSMYTDRMFSMEMEDEEGNSSTAQYLANQDGSLKKNAWAKWKGIWYYFGSDGAGVKGVQNVGGKKYFFENGEMQTSCVVNENGKYYICKADGTLAEAKNNDWTKLDGNWYYMKQGTLLKNSVEKIGNARYVFDKYGVMQKNGFFWSSREGSMCYAKEDGTLAVNTWMSNGAGWYYFDQDGKSVDGVQTINQKKYYFIEGVMQTNRTVSEGGSRYVAKADGTLVEAKNNSWVKADGKWYYVKNGEFCEDGVVQISGKYYMFDGKGRMMQKGLGSLNDGNGTEWVYAEENGSLSVNKWRNEDGFGMMYFGKDGKALGNGVYAIGGVNYLFDANHVLRTSSALRVNNKNYAADANGKAIELKEKWNKVGRYWYYVKNGKILESTMETIGSNSYYFDYYGRMLTNGLESYVREGTGSDYTTILTNEKGEIQKNKQYEGWNGTFLFDADGTGAEGFRTISGIRRYFREGKMLQSTSFQVGDTYYAAADNGKVVTLANNGWTKVDSDWYYVDNGKLVKYGRITIKGKTYVFGAAGKLMSNEAVDDTDQGMLGAASDGTMLKNSWAKLQIQRDHGGYDTSYGWSYFDENGQAVEGLQTIKGKQYYFRYGIMQADKVVQLDDGSLWIADHNGVLKKAAKNGWSKVDGNWYYATNGVAAKNCIRKIGTEYYAFDWNGKMKVNCNFELGNDDEETYGFYHAKADGTLLRNGSWKASNGDQYYFDANGKGYEGYQKVNGVTYWFEQGRLAKNTAVQDEYGNMYVMDAKGKPHAMKNNQWIKVDGYYYYAMDGEVVRDRIICVDGKYYGFDEHGKMYDNKTFTVYGNTYHATSGGALLTSAQYKSGKDTYYFDRDGVGYEGVHYIAGKRCVFENGKIVG